MDESGFPVQPLPNPSPGFHGCRVHELRSQTAHSNPTKYPAERPVFPQAGGAEPTSPNIPKGNPPSQEFWGFLGSLSSPFSQPVRLGFLGVFVAETRVFRPSVNTGYRLRHFPSRITDFDRPSFSITNQRFLGFSGLWLSVFVVFLGVREHDLPTFTVPIRIVVSTPFHRFPADSPPDSGFLGVREHDLPTFPVPIRIDVSTRFHWFLPVWTRFHTIPYLCAASRPTCPASPPDPVLAVSRGL